MAHIIFIQKFIDSNLMVENTKHRTRANRSSGFQPSTTELKYTLTHQCFQKPAITNSWQDCNNTSSKSHAEANPCWKIRKQQPYCYI